MCHRHQRAGLEERDDRASRARAHHYRVAAQANDSPAWSVLFALVAIFGMVQAALRARSGWGGEPDPWLSLILINGMAALSGSQLAQARWESVVARLWRESVEGADSAMAPRERQHRHDPLGRSASPDRDVAGIAGGAVAILLGMLLGAVDVELLGLWGAKIAAALCSALGGWLLGRAFWRPVAARLWSERREEIEARRAGTHTTPGGPRTAPRHHLIAAGASPQRWNQDILRAVFAVVMGVACYSIPVTLAGRGENPLSESTAMLRLVFSLVSAVVAAWGGYALASTRWEPLIARLWSERREEADGAPAPGEHEPLHHDMARRAKRIDVLSVVAGAAAILLAITTGTWGVERLGTWAAVVVLTFFAATGGWFLAGAYWQRIAALLWSERSPSTIGTPPSQDAAR